MALRVYSFFKSNIVIDGELIPIRIRRMDPDQAIEFNQNFSRLGRAASQEPPKEETPEARADREKKSELEERDYKKFVVSAISSYVSVEPGHLFRDEEETSVTTGAEVVRLFGARDEVLSELLLQIFLENRLNAEQKHNWKTRLAPFVPTPEDVADRMMEISNVGPSDVVVDLGCGSGRLCIAAAKRGARVFGYDIDAERIAEAKEAAQKAGVEVTFEQKDALTVDLSTATVVAIYLLSGACSKLRPVFQNKLPDGARVVSHAFTLGGGWVPFHSEFVPAPEGEKVAHAGARWIYAYSIDSWRKNATYRA